MGEIPAERQNDIKKLLLDTFTDDEKGFAQALLMQTRGFRFGVWKLQVDPNPESPAALTAENACGNIIILYCGGQWGGRVR